MSTSSTRKKEVYAFYASMRNQGKLLTRSSVLNKTDPDDSEKEENKGDKIEKRQRLNDKGNSKAIEVGQKTRSEYILFDVYFDKQSFQHKTNVESHIVLWLQDEVDFEQLKQLGEQVRLNGGKQCQLALT